MRVLARWTRGGGRADATAAFGRLQRDGGALRVHSDGSYYEILPDAGSLVLFDSMAAEHEVRPRGHDVARADVRHAAADVLGRVDGQVAVLHDLEPVRKSNVRVSKPKTPRARTPSTLALRRGGQNSK